MAPKASDEAHAPVRLVTLSEVKELLEREQKTRAPPGQEILEGEGLTYEQKLALDHAQHFAKLPPGKANELAHKLLKLGGRVTEYYAFRIADLLPTHPDDVKAIYARERSVPDNEEIEKVLATVREYV